MTASVFAIWVQALVLLAPPPQPAAREKNPAVKPARSSRVPPKLALAELALTARSTDGRILERRVRVGHPVGWTGDEDLGRRAIRLFGPEGEGEILIVAALHPDELGEHLTRLKDEHPSAAPSPPMAMAVPGIDPVKGERATRFVITGREGGEMVLIERGGAIVLIATIVAPEAWSDLSAVMERCYPTVEVFDLEDRSRGGRPRGE